MKQLSLGLLLLACAVATAAPTTRHPVIPGLSRDGLDPRLRGLVLLGELGCTSCHSAGPREKLFTAKSAPDLSSVGARVDPEYLRAFLADPHGVKPGTTMPDVLGQRSEAERRAVAEALTHYLISLSPRRFSVQAPDRVAAIKGRELFHSIGCVACHSPRDDDGAELSSEDSAPLGRLDRKYSVASLTAFLEMPHRARPSGRMPDFHLTPGEAYQIANYLVRDARVPGPLPSERLPAIALAPFVVDAAKADAGKSLFGELGCASCHRSISETPPRALPDLSSVDPLKGCLSAEEGDAPSYALSARQIEETRAALAATDLAPTPEQTVRATLAAFNCIACHQRGDFGGIPKSRNDYYLSADENLGETGRIPPPLTGVGAKLQRDWLRKTMAGGQALRPYLTMRMPGFGAENVGHLAALFEALDHVPAVAFDPPPRGRDEVQAVKDMGRLLVGDKGMSCITCHTFRGLQAGTMAAVDLVETTAQRLRKDWFYHYMLEPVRFRSITIMPQFFPDGASILKEVAEGDPKTQLDAMWQYLAEGRNTREPSGVRRPPMEIVVGDEAVMLRRSAQDTGKRAISVGYPLGVNLTFDAESVALNQIWWGKFIDPGGVWTGQGSGSVRILSRDRVQLGLGPALAKLADETAPWPTQTSRTLGLRFRGYELDERRRPTFQYVYRDIAIRDKPEESRDASTGRPSLRRTIELSGPRDAVVFFRAAVHDELEALADGTIGIGRSVRVSVRGSSSESSSSEALTARIRPSAEGMEAVVPVAMKDGAATLLLEYRWLETSQ